MRALSCRYFLVSFDLIYLLLLYACFHLVWLFIRFCSRCAYGIALFYHVFASTGGGVLLVIWCFEILLVYTNKCAAWNMHRSLNSKVLAILWHQIVILGTILLTRQSRNLIFTIAISDNRIRSIMHIRMTILAYQTVCRRLKRISFIREYWALLGSIHYFNVLIWQLLMRLLILWATKSKLSLLVMWIVYAGLFAWVDWFSILRLQLLTAELIGHRLQLWFRVLPCRLFIRIFFGLLLRLCCFSISRLSLFHLSFLLLLGQFFFQQSSFFLFLAFTSSREFVPYIICFLYEDFVLLILLFFVQRWKYDFIIVARSTSQLLSFEFKSLSESFFLHLVSLCWIYALLLSCEDSYCQILLLQAYQFLSLFLIYVQQFESISQYLLLYFIVEPWVSLEWWRLIYFDQPWLEIVVNHNVETQDLKTHGVVVVIWLARPVYVRHEWLSNDQGLHNDVLYLVHYLVGISTLLQQYFQYGI